MAAPEECLKFRGPGAIAPGEIPIAARSHERWNREPASWRGGLSGQLDRRCSADRTPQYHFATQQSIEADRDLRTVRAKISARQVLGPKAEVLFLQVPGRGAPRPQFRGFGEHSKGFHKEWPSYPTKCV